MTMKYSIHHLAPHAALLFLLLVSSCGISPLSGNSSETTNSITAVATYGGIGGIAPPFSSLYLIGETYDPLSGKPYDSVATDTTGIYSFTAAKGGYHLFCRKTDTLQSILHLHVGGTTSGNNDTLRDTLRRPGSMEGYAPVNEDTSLTSYLFIEGTPFFATADANSGYFRIDNIPQGRYVVRRFSVKTDEVEVVETDTLSSESSTVVGIVSDSLVLLPWER